MNNELHELHKLSTEQKTTNDRTNDSYLTNDSYVDELDLETGDENATPAVSTAPAGFSKYTKIRYASNTVNVALGYTVGHAGQGSSLLTQGLATGLSGAFLGGLASVFTISHADENLTWRERATIIGSNSGLAISTAFLVDGLMSASAEACWWVPPLLAGLVIVAPDALPAAWQKFSLWRASRAPNASATINNTNDEPMITATPKHSYTSIS